MLPHQDTSTVRLPDRLGDTDHDMRTLLVLIALGPLLCPAVDDTRDHAVAVFKQGDYEGAIPLLQTAIHEAPKDVSLRSDLLSALVYEGRLDEASDAAESGEADFPNAPEMLAARGEYEFYLGDIMAAEKLFREALQVKETPRGFYGLSRIAQMLSNYHSARMFCLRAHALDSDDALITQRFLGYVPRDKREPQLSQFVAAHPWFYKDVESFQKTREEIKTGLEGQKAFQQSGERKETTIKLIPMMSGPNRIYGLGVDFRINDGHVLRLLLDTGASGILLNQKAVDKAELDHLGSFKSGGIGDAGRRNTFAAVSDTCKVGRLKFEHCIVSALQGKRANLGEDADGLIGADFFDDYVIELDFQKRIMHLTPLPPQTPDPEGHDRNIPPEEKDFVPVLRQGDHLYIPTKLNDSSWGLFLLDTGASLSNVDSTFARFSTKIRGNSYMRVHGISGEVKDVFEADKAVLQFARFRQNNLGLISFNLNNRPDHQEFRMSGILGIPVLSMFRLSIDYRNGLVKFDYIFDKKKD